MIFAPAGDADARGDALTLGDADGAGLGVGDGDGVAVGFGVAFDLSLVFAPFFGVAVGAGVGVDGGTLKLNLHENPSTVGHCKPSGACENG